MVKKTQNMQETAFPTVEEDDAFTSLRAKLAEINKHPEVTGYIMRNDTSAIIDLKNPARLTEYAILTSQAVESAQQISELFNMGTTENILITGKDTQVLCIAIGENNAAIFMEKNADHNDILSRLQLASG
jgi:predicted regulator of Ras-like GTPase activity (Roadblock/LC7/MglB family)